MRKRAVLTLLATTLCMAAGPSSTAKKAKWALTFDVKVDEMNGQAPAKPKVFHRQEASCQGPMTKDEAQALAAGAMDADGCTFHETGLNNGRISLAGSCPPDADGFSYDLDADGTYDDRKLRMNLHGRVAQDGDHALISGTIVGVRTGSCK